MSYRVVLASLSIVFASAYGALAQEGDPTAGAVVFKKCALCHVVETDTNKVGPSLHGLLGRTAGTHPNFAYSSAMMEAGKGGLVWDAVSLRDYLHNPRKKVKGTKMAFVGIKNDTDISNLLAYLKQFSK